MISHRQTLRRAPLLLLAATCLTHRAPAAEPVFELPKLTVNEPADLPELEVWNHTRVGEFEVLSSGSEREARKLLADFEKFQRAVRLLWPVPIRPLAASTLILCGDRGHFDRFVPRQLRGGEAPLPSLFLRDREQVAIVVDLQTTRVAISDAAATLNAANSGAEYEIDPYRQLYREYVHFLLSQSDAPQPAWLKEGLAQIIMDVELTDRHLIYGKVNSHRGEASGVNPLEPAEDADAAVANAVVGEQPFNVVLQYRRLMPLDEFFAIGPDAEVARHPLGNNLWAKQAYAFVHYCLFGARLKYKDALASFVERLTREPPSEALFRACFQTDYRGMVEELNGYLRHTRHQYQRYDLRDADRVRPADITLARADATRIGLVKGDAFLLAGDREAAYVEYRQAYRRGGRDPALLAGLGATVPDAAMAGKFTDQAVQAGVRRPSAYIRQSAQRLARIHAEPGFSGRLDESQLAAVLGPLFQARALAPARPETYLGIAEAWSLSAVPPAPKHLAVLDEGVRRFPREGELLRRTALLHRQAGETGTAVAIARLGRRFAASPALQAEFDAIIDAAAASAGGR